VLDTKDILYKYSVTSIMLFVFFLVCLIVTLLLCLSLCWRHSSSPGLSLFPLLSSTLPGPSTSEVMTLWLCTNTFIIFIIIILWPRYSIPREWKITLCNAKKYKNQAGMNLTSPPSQNSRAVMWHCTAESKRSVAGIGSCLLSPNWSAGFNYYYILSVSVD